MNASAADATSAAIAMTPDFMITPRGRSDSLNRRY
jgi:hypothetical protein